MASSSAVLVDDSFLSKLDLKLEAFERVLAQISGVAVLVLVGLAVVSVTGRHFLNSPLPGYVDWIEAIMPIIAFLGLSYMHRQGGHIRMDILVSQLRGRPLWFFELVSTVMIILLLLALIWGSWAHFDRSFDMTRPMWSRDSSMDINLPIWPAKLLVPFAFSVLLVRNLVHFWGYGRAFVLGLPAPVAVPMIQSAAEIAAAEAEKMEQGRS